MVQRLIEESGVGHKVAVQILRRDQSFDLTIQPEQLPAQMS